MAAIPSSGSLLATYDYYRRRLDSTFSNSSCGSIECPGEAIPHPPACFSGSPPSRSWPRCWSPQSTRNPRPPAPQASSSMTTGVLARDAPSPAQPALGPGPDLSGYHQPRPVEALVHQSPSPPPAPSPTPTPHPLDQAAAASRPSHQHSRHQKGVRAQLSTARPRHWLAFLAPGTVHLAPSGK
ncbi:pancreatic progenitor cell differentiation and proliferation factor-like [Macaca nemestrina]|uniref:pancreatic progenitor cell differentiation and proliferation factor-like n=1 Tax=Macaca nemestrina TaxID=9545 RepID=UPI0039B945D7